MTQKKTLQIPLDFDGLPDGSALLPAAYLDMGEGTPIVMLHGFMGSAVNWLPLIELLKPNFRCIGIDLFGFGASARPLIRYDIAKEVAFLRQVVQVLELDSFYLLGHSFGGWVSAAYTLQYPESVKGLILAAPAGIRDDSFCGRYDHLRPILWQTPVIDWALALIKPIAVKIGQEKTIAQIAWMRQELNAQPAARSFLVDRLRPEDAIDTVEKEIHQITAPTLVITGDRDETIPLWHSETYAREIPNAKLSILNDADHSLPQHHSPELASLISQWCSLHP
jgi:pimeloyl-ACP methyl ester carboxylesterase